MRFEKIPAEILALAAGDVLMIGVVTLVGFARHGEFESAGLRPLATMLPFTLTWMLLAPLLHTLKLEWAVDRRQLWRPAVAALVAAPFAAMLRALLLQSPVVPIFVIVLGVTMACGIVLWRLIFLTSYKRLRAVDG